MQLILFRIKSHRPKDSGNIVLDEITSWTPGTKCRAEHTYDHYNDKLGPWEVEDKRNSSEHHLLQDHREANDNTNHDSKHTTGAHQDKGFIKIQNLNAAFGEAHGSHDSYFFCLVHQVGAHAGTKRKEAQEHRDCYNNVEDYVQDVFDLVVCFVILKVIYDFDGVQDFWCKAFFDLIG